MKNSLFFRIFVLGLVLMSVLPVAVFASNHNIEDCTCGKKDCTHDYSSLTSDEYFEVIEEIDAEYKVCYTELIHELSLDVFTPVCFAIESRERAMQFLEPRQWWQEGGIDLYDYDSKNGEHPESLRDILSSYDESFYKNNFLWIVYRESSRIEPLVLCRLDVAKSTGENNKEVLVTIVDCPAEDATDVMYWIVIELPRKYLTCIEGHFENDDRFIQYHNENPQTGDSTMLLPAMGAMVIAAAGIVVTKKRKK